MNGGLTSLRKQITAVKSIEKFGIDNLKLVLTFVLGTERRIRELVNEFSVSKALTVAFSIAENQYLLDRKEQILAEIKDLSDDETRELVAQFGLEFDLVNDTLENRIEQGMNFIPRGYELAKLNVGFVVDVSDWAKGFKGAVIV